MRCLLLLYCLFTLPSFARYHTGKIVSQGRDPLKGLALFKHALAEAKKSHQPDEMAEALIQIAAILKKQDAEASIRDPD